MNLAYCSGVTTRSWNSIRLWSTPHSSAQRPSYVPVLFAVNSNSLVFGPGMMSFL